MYLTVPFTACILEVRVKIVLFRGMGGASYRKGILRLFVWKFQNQFLDYIWEVYIGTYVAESGILLEGVGWRVGQYK